MSVELSPLPCLAALLAKDGDRIWTGGKLSAAIGKERVAGANATEFGTSPRHSTLRLLDQETGVVAFRRSVGTERK